MGCVLQQGDTVVAHDKVAFVSVRDCRTSRLHLQCPALQCLEVHNLTASMVCVAPCNLHTLRLLNCSKMTEGGIRGSLVRLTSLRELDVSANMPITDETLREVCFCMFSTSALHTLVILQFCVRVHVMDSSPVGHVRMA